MKDKNRDIVTKLEISDNDLLAIHALEVIDNEITGVYFHAYLKNDVRKYNDMYYLSQYQNYGENYIQNEYAKLYTNILDSAKKSKYYSTDTNKIYFSNGDIYIFDLNDHNIYKNGGILAQDLYEFSFTELLELSGLTLSSSALQNASSLYFNVTFVKYGNKVSKDVVITVGDGI